MVHCVYNRKMRRAIINLMPSTVGYSAVAQPSVRICGIAPKI